MLCTILFQDGGELVGGERVGLLRDGAALAEGEPPGGEAQPAELIGGVGFAAHTGEAELLVEALAGGVWVGHEGVDVPVAHGVQHVQQGGVEHIAQSETFLKQFQLPATAMPNTAMAAKFVAESGNKTKAAIASVETAALYGLEVLVPNINTDGDNTTRFIVLSREKPTTGNRFSLLFTVDNKPGKLGEVIQMIGASGFNMESIKSRPMPHVPFEYYFYVELVGDPTRDETAALLHELDRICRTVRLLGVYTK